MGGLFFKHGAKGRQGVQTFTFALQIGGLGGLC